MIHTCAMQILCTPSLDDRIAIMTVRVSMVGMFAPCAALPRAMDSTHYTPTCAHGGAEL